MKLNNNWKEGVFGRVKQIAGKNPAQFAKNAKIIDQTFRKYINGESIPGGKNLIKLAKEGKVTTDWLLTGHEASNSPPAWTFDPKVRDSYGFLQKLVSEVNEGVKEGRTPIKICQIIKNVMDNQLLKLDDIKKDEN